MTRPVRIRATVRRAAPRDHAVPRRLAQAASVFALAGMRAAGSIAGPREQAVIGRTAPHRAAGRASLGIREGVRDVAATLPDVGSDIGLRVARFRSCARDRVEMIGERRHRRAIDSLDRFVPKAMAGAQEATT